MKLLVVSEGKPEKLLEQFKDMSEVEAKVATPRQALSVYNRWGPDWVVAPPGWLEKWLKSLREPDASLARVHIQSRTHHGIEIVPIEKVLFFRAEDKYVVAYHEKGQLVIEDTLNKLEEEFSSQFIRIHRKTLVSRHAILALEKTEDGTFTILVENLDQKLEVSRRQLPKIRKWLKSLQTTKS